MIETYCMWYETLQELKMSVKHVHRPQVIHSKRIHLDRQHSVHFNLRKPAKEMFMSTKRSSVMPENE